VLLPLNSDVTCTAYFRLGLNQKVRQNPVAKSIGIFLWRLRRKLLRACGAEVHRPPGPSYSVPMTLAIRRTDTMAISSVPWM
jgi:hypothetical protein